MVLPLMKIRKLMEVKWGFTLKHVKVDRPIRTACRKIWPTIGHMYLKFRGERGLELEV